MHADMPAADERWMGVALERAEEALRLGEVPVGAVLVSDEGRLLSSGRNRREADRDPLAHAEVEAIRTASQRLGAWRLLNTTLYVTLEPCPMCAGALVNARVTRVVYGCTDPKAGAVDTLFGIGRDPRLNHRFDIVAGVRAEECSAILKRFFGALRNRERRPR